MLESTTCAQIQRSELRKGKYRKAIGEPISVLSIVVKCSRTQTRKVDVEERLVLSKTAEFANQTDIFIVWFVAKCLCCLFHLRFRAARSVLHGETPEDLDVFDFYFLVGATSCIYISDATCRVTATNCRRPITGQH